MKIGNLIGGVVVSLLATASGAAFAANILIVNGTSTTTESGTTSDITTSLQTECAAGNTFTVSDTRPGSLDVYDQIWDLRFSNTSPLDSGDQLAYLAFLQSGKRMFVMGENGSFTTRNDSISAFVTAVGGGTLTFSAPSSTQTVNPPFNAPAAVSSITYDAPGGVTSPGTGAYATTDGTNGTAVAWATGTLGNAPTGSLATVFDVNFMQSGAGADSLNFLRNLCGFVATGGEPVTPKAVPTLSVYGLAGTSLALALFGAYWLRNRRRAGVC